MREKERERSSKENRHFLPGSWCRKVISVVMYSCFGNIRFLTEWQTTIIRTDETTEKLVKREGKTMRRRLSWDKVTYPGTLGRFLTVQVLCHLGHKEKSH